MPGQLEHWQDVKVYDKFKSKLSISDVIIDRAVSDFYRYFFNPNAIENDN